MTDFLGKCGRIVGNTKGPVENCGHTFKGKCAMGYFLLK